MALLAACLSLVVCEPRPDRVREPPSTAEGDEVASAPAVRAKLALDASDAPDEPCEDVRPLPRPTRGGALVRFDRVELPASVTFEIRPGPLEEVFIVVESGDFGQALGWVPGAVARVEHSVVTEASVASKLLVAVVTGEAPASSPTVHRGDGEPAWGKLIHAADVPTLHVAEGRLRVRIFHDEGNGARFGALSHLDADPGFGVPKHVHAKAAEVLFIESGDGTMMFGEERRALRPGDVIYVPAGVEHGYAPGSTPLRAWQIYAPPGPEQRFRPPSGK